MGEVVVAKDVLLATAAADPRDHRRVVHLVREDDAAGQHLGERRERGLVRDVARGEEQGGLLAMEVGQFGLELDVIMRVAADVSRASRARADAVERFLHRGDHVGMLAHAEVIVRAPHGDVLRVGRARITARAGEAALGPQDVDEHAIAPLGMKVGDRATESSLVIHNPPSSKRTGPRTTLARMKEPRALGNLAVRRRHSG